MPERLSYDEAMLFAPARLKIADPELKQGQVEKIKIETKLGPVERPWGIEGGFAVVYKFRTRSGQHRALRCFRVPMKPDTQQRYERIGSYFHDYARDITAGFKYHDAGIMVKEQGKSEAQAYPVIEMDWIEGATLLEKVDELCKKQDRASLHMLSDQWLSILMTLRKARIAHGDLAGVNVMVKSDGKLVLIDYDGVFIPGFERLTQVLLGQIDYQHPQMSKRQFNEHMDQFSALAIYTALLAVAARPDLWNKYMKRGDNGKLLDVNMLFTQQDFKEPDQSKLMQELETLSDQRVVAAVRELKQQSLQPVEQARFPLAIVDPDYAKKQAFALLENAISADDDEQIASAWTPILDSFNSVQPYRARVEIAQHRVKALQRFRNAQLEPGIQNILTNYDPLLDASQNVTSDERELLSLSHSLVQAFKDDDDETITDIFEQLQNKYQHKKAIPNWQETQRFSLAQQRQIAMRELRLALDNGDIEQIVAAYKPTQYPYKGLKEQERAQIEMAFAFAQVYRSNDDEAILKAYEAIQNFSYSNPLKLSEQHRQRVSLAQQRKEVAANFSSAMASKQPRRIAAAYNAALNINQPLTPEEREQAILAQAFTRAFADGNEEALLNAYDSLQKSSFGFMLDTEEMRRIALAKQRLQALRFFRDALRSQIPWQIDNAYDPVLDGSKDLNEQERVQLELARRFVQGYTTNSDETLYRVLNNATSRIRLKLTNQEEHRLELATQRYPALVIFRQAWTDHYRDSAQLVAAYNKTLLDSSSDITPEQRRRVEMAYQHLQMCQEIREAININNDDAILKAFNKPLDLEFDGFTRAERERISQVAKWWEARQAVKDALANKEYERAIKMAQDIARTTRKPVDTELIFPLNKAMMRFIQEQDITDLQVVIEENPWAGVNSALARWQWPTNEMVQHVLIVWSAENWPVSSGRGRQAEPVQNHEILVRRTSRMTEGTHTFPIGRYAHIYVQVYAAIYDSWDEAHPTWRYSKGFEPTSRCEAGKSAYTWETYRRNNVTT